MIRHFLLLLILLSFNNLLRSQVKPISTKPKLVVAIVVDQMRNDYLYRYWDRYSAGGFKRLVNGGYYFKNAHYNYIPTYTGPGHSSIFTGSTPRTHGIIGNDWYVKTNNTWVNCVEDQNVNGTGTDAKAGKASPHNQLSSTVSDELKMSSNQRSKVIAIALKDRSAIFPAGHAGDAAYWLEEATGNFVSSSWYIKELPQWVKSFNEKKLAKAYLQKGWNTLYPIESYINSTPDDSRYEGSPFKDKPVFPYDFKYQLEKNEVGIIRATPFGNSLTKDLALECLRNEKLGQGSETDFFSISFSSTDVVGHAYGTRAIETADTYLRLDKDLELLLNALDAQVGKNNYTVFLTADHGGADVPNHLIDKKIPAGYLRDSQLSKTVKQFLKENYGDTALLANLSNEQIFINEPKMYGMNLNKDEVEERLCKFLLTQKGIAECYPSSVMKYGSFEKNDYRDLLQRGYNHKLSGNVCYIYEPAWMDYADRGTTHGAGYNYDTHVPIIFYGSGIKKGENFEYVTITQIAPTICELLQINQPNSCTSEPLNNYFK